MNKYRPHGSRKELMKIGTKSLLFGVHQIIIHPICVYRAWRYLYGRPKWREVICIIIHDWGYFGKPNIDGPEGSRHPEYAARLATKLFGIRYGDLCLYHSRHYARDAVQEPSKLCWADKLSIIMEPKWFYLFRARISGELREFREEAAADGFMSIDQTDSVWYDWISGFMAEMGRLNSRPYGRIQGKTTAHIIRLLFAMPTPLYLPREKEIIECCIDEHNAYAYYDWFRRETLKIADILEKRGHIITRPIITEPIRDFMDRR